MLCAATQGLAQEGQPVQDQPSGGGVPDQPQQNAGQPLQPEASAPAPNAVDTTPATLHGVVRNAVTGEGVPRALVRIEGDAQTGALTDGDGRFEITGLPVGPQAVEVSKPGFFNPAYGVSPGAPAGAAGPPENVLVAAEMADVTFTLTPTCTIDGRIDLSSGDTAEGMQVALLRRVVQDGRAVWQPDGFARARSDGSYRFGELGDGEYMVYTMPALDSEPAVTAVAPGKAGAAEHWGYASIFYPNARGPAGAQAIAVAHGAEVQANFLLTREAFEAVTVEVTGPQAFAGARPQNFNMQLMDGAGHDLPYEGQYDERTRTVQAALPEGNYSLLITSNGLPAAFEGVELGRVRLPAVLVGEVNFAVADHAVTGLRVPLSAPAEARVDVTVNRNGAGTAPSGDAPVEVMVSSAGGMGGELVTQYASGTAEGTLNGSYVPPGVYWVHAYVNGGGLCEQSFTAGGANLAREPLTIGPGGVTTPLELTLRDDCARLELSLPENATALNAGVEPYYTVYVVPDFDSTRDLSPAVLRPSVDTSYTVSGLTPGNYHVYTFAGDVRLEYRNPAALAALEQAGQAVTLSPGETGTLVVEVPGQ
jgi:hypothetical protein